MKRITLVLLVLFISSQVFSMEIPLQSTPLNEAINQNPNVYLYLSTVQGATSYDFEFSLNPSFTSSTIVNRTTNYCPTGELLFGETYYWRVRAKNETETTVWSDVWSFTTNPLGASPSSPSNGSENTDVSLVLSTNKVPGATTIEYEVDVVPSFDSGQLQTYSHPFNYSGPRVSNLQYGQTYYWRVRGQHVADTSDWSNTWSFTTNPLGTTPSSPSNGSESTDVSILLSTNNVTGSTTIEYEVDVVPTFDSGQQQTYSHPFNYSGKRVSNLQYGQTYYWRARGLHVADTSDWSDTWSFTTNSLGASPSSPSNGSENRDVSLLLSVNKVYGSTTIEYELDTVPTFNSEQLQTYSHSDSYSSQRVSNLQYGQTYYWRVRGLHVADTSDWAETRSFTTNPLGATPSSPSNGSENRDVSLLLSVNKVYGSTTIEYELDTVPTFNSEQLQTYSHSDSYSSQRVSNLQYGQTYYWRVRGLHAADTSDWAETRSFTANPLGATPSSPASGSVDRPISLTLWVNKVTGSENIDYQLDTTDSFNSALLQEYTHSDSYSGQPVADLRYGQKYFWRVRGWHDADESDWSSVWDFTTGFELTEGPALVSPENNAIDIPYVSVAMIWASLAGIDTYQYQLSEDMGFTAIVKSGETSLTFTSAENLTPSKTYYWRVRGENVNGYSPWSSIWAFTTAAVELAPPIQLSPEDNATITEDEVDLVWDEVFGASGYRVQVSPSESFDSGVAEFLAEGTAHPITGLSAGLTYYWRVSAFDNAVESGWSDTWSFTYTEPSLEVPLLVSPQDNATITEDEVDLVWDEVFGASGYRVQVSPSESFDSGVAEFLTEGTVHPITGLSAGLTYYWRVSAFDNAVESGWSDTWSFTYTEPSLEVPLLVSPQDNATGVGLEEVSFSWTEILEANTYTIEISEDESFENLYYTTSTSSTSQVVSELVHETTYFWRVNASNESLTSDWSEVWSFVTIQCTGVDEFSPSIFTVYPNPAKSYISIDIDGVAPNATVEIYGTLGQLIISKPFCPNLDISGLNSGVYVLQVRVDGAIIGKTRFVKE
ncbi:MAG: T9SS type A sorting domain-containing protein [Bacteroidales bacterium]|nr:T9SS type A sorting domain-containing protein [Bacteroidales bacterium]